MSLFYWSEETISHFRFISSYLTKEQTIDKIEQFILIDCVPLGGETEEMLKEDLINKSTNVTTDGASNTKYPSVKAVKDYVDSSINLGGTALTNEANIRAAADLSLTNALNTEITSRINFDLLKEDVANKSSNVTTDASSTTKYPSVRAIKTYVDASDSSLTTNLNAEVAARIAGDNSLIANISAEVSRATSVDNTLTNNILQELTRATAAEATKEDLSNKSTNVSNDGASNTKYPSVKAVKDYVDFESLNDQTGTTYSLQASDSGKVLTLNNASAITLTVPTGLPAGFNCTIVQKGAGAVTFVSGTGVTIANRLSRTITAGQNAVATIVSISSNYFITSGDMQ